MSSKEDMARDILNKNVKFVRHVSRIPKPESYSEELKNMINAAKLAGDLLLKEAARDGGPRGGGDKADVDEEIEALLQVELQKLDPSVGFIGEELGQLNPESKRAYIVDPHDGSRDFLKGARTTSVSIALVEDGRFLAALVYCPFSDNFLGETFLATWERGDKLRHNGKLVAFRPQHAITETTNILVSTRLSPFKDEIYGQSLEPANLTNCASIATRLALAAIGKYHAAMTIGHRLSDWDFAAGQALLEAAGGGLFDASGQRIEWQGLKSIETQGLGYFGSAGSALSWEIARRLGSTFKWNNQAN